MRQHVGRLLLLGVLGLAAAFYVQPRFLSTDETDVFVQARALSFGHLYLDEFAHELPAGAAGRRGTHGHIYSRYGIGYPLLAAPALRLARAVGQDTIIQQLRAFKWPNAFLFLVSGWVFYALLRHRSGRRGVSALLCAAYLLTTQATFEASTWSSNGIVMVLLLFALWAVETAPPADQRRRLIFAGICIGFAGLCRTFPFAAALPFALVVGLRCRRRGEPLRPALLCLLVPVAAFAAATLAVTYAKLGAWSSPYGSEGFTAPFHVGFLGSLLWPGKSFVFFNPVTLAFPLGLAAMLRSSRTSALLCLLVAALFVGAYSKWWAWWSGPWLGNRFWIPALPFLLYPLVQIRRRIGLALVALLMLWGGYTQVRLVAQHPGFVYHRIYQQFPYPENTRSVRRTLAEDPLAPVRATFVDRLFYRSLN